MAEKKEKTLEDIMHDLWMLCVDNQIESPEVTMLMPRKVLIELQKAKLAQDRSYTAYSKDFLKGLNLQYGHLGGCAVKVYEDSVVLSKNALGIFRTSMRLVKELNGIVSQLAPNMEMHTAMGTGRLKYEVERLFSDYKNLVEGVPSETESFEGEHGEQIPPYDPAGG